MFWVNLREAKHTLTRIKLTGMMNTLSELNNATMFCNPIESLITEQFQKSAPIHTEINLNVTIMFKAMPLK